MGPLFVSVSSFPRLDCYTDVLIISRCHRFILYIYYFPSNSKYYSIIASNQGSVIQTETTPLIPSGHDETDEPRVRPPRIATPEWRLAIALGIFVAAHL